MKRFCAILMLTLTGGLIFAPLARGETYTPLWSNVHRDHRSFPTSAQLAPFTDAAGWQDQEVAGPRWWRYAKGTRSEEATLPEAWYLHVNGARVHDKAHPRLYVMNPERRGWWLHVAPDCAIRCFLDGMGEAAMWRTVPRLPATWTPPRWLRATTMEIRGITNWGGRVLPNSAFTPSYVERWNAAGGRASTEGFRGLGDLSILKAGHVWVFAKTQTVGACGRLVATYLIGAGRGDHFSCFELPAEPWSVPNSLMGPRVGKPLAPAVKTATGWRRSYAHAVVRINYDGSYEIKAR